MTPDRKPAARSWFAALRAAPAKWRRRDRTERKLLAEAFVLLGVARFLVLAAPFRWLACSLGRHMRESAPEVSGPDLETARLIGQAVRSAAANTPWKSVCLPQAVTGKWMLQRRNIAATVYLGVVKAEAGKGGLAAHAWLRCGGLILTGAEGHRRFTVVSTFA